MLTEKHKSQLYPPLFLHWTGLSRPDCVCELKRIGRTRVHVYSIPNALVKSNSNRLTFMPGYFMYIWFVTLWRRDIQFFICWFTLRVKSIRMPFIPSGRSFWSQIKHWFENCVWFDLICFRRAAIDTFVNRNIFLKRWFIIRVILVSFNNFAAEWNVATDFSSKSQEKTQIFRCRTHRQLEQITW